MTKKSNRSKESSRARRPQDWSPEEKLRVVVESRGLADEELILDDPGEHLEHDSLASSGMKLHRAAPVTAPGSIGL